MFSRWRSRRSRPVVVDADQQAADIAASTGIPLEQVRDVLELEFERMVLQGIASAPGYAFRFYPPEEQAGISASPRLDDERVALDAERLAGVPAEVGRRVLQAEIEDLDRRGLTGG